MSVAVHKTFKPNTIIFYCLESDLEYEESTKTMEESSSFERFMTAVSNGNVCEVKELLETGKCDVNKCDQDDYGNFDIETLPLFVSLINIKTKDDEFYQISKLLLAHKDIDVNITDGYRMTILGRLCEKKVRQHLEWSCF